MDWVKAWLKPVLLVLVWVTVVSYTLSMAKTVGPSLRAMGQQA